MKLQLWIAEQSTDNPCYNAIGRTRKEVLAEMAKYSHMKYHTLTHAELDYASGYDLFEQVTGEGGGRNVDGWKKLKVIDLRKEKEDDE